MWSENFGAVREMFFFQRGDLHNSLDAVCMCVGRALLQRGTEARARERPDRTAPAPTITVLSVTEQRMFELSSSAQEV